MQVETKIQEQLRKKNISEKQVERQLAQFLNGIDFINLDRACTIGDGLKKLTANELTQFIALYESKANDLKILKFVPASGAATRMFKHLFDFQETAENALSQEFFQRLPDFPFFSELKNQLPNISDLLNQKQYAKIIDTILVNMNFGNIPKGCIPFHKYSSDIRTAFEEHLYEGKDYGKGKQGKICVHFTIAETHAKTILELLHQRIRACFLHDNVLVNFSYQLPETDTITVDLQNNPLANEQGELIFRPGGHGALIYNLNDLDADLIFIKNIDNVVPDSQREDTLIYKKALAGVALEFKYLRDKILVDIGSNRPLDQEDLIRLKNTFEIDLSAKNRQEIKGLLDRPIRVCGMVKNQGEPGGGPFWVKDSEGNLSKQIVETSQIDFSKKSQKQIVENASHFNPVDLVCITKDHQGISYDLHNFVDENTGFISEKSRAGQTIKALELPGLWNGAMAGWNTVFVEVPLTTFNPVKTVNDLLRPVRTGGMKK